MKPILTIAIPTYHYPDEVIANVKYCLSCDRNDIEVIVVDNDDTGEEIKGDMLKIDDSRFHYYQNDTNIGRSNNIVRAIERSSADFVFLCSSDDKIELGMLTNIIEIIKGNTNLSLIMGRIKNDIGKIKYSDKSGFYSKGFEAVNSLNFMGNLVPMVINKTYLCLSELYDCNETYMQYRISLILANKGKICYLGKIIGYQKDNLSYSIDKVKSILDAVALKTWNFDLIKPYYHPESRIKQLLTYLDIIDLSQYNQYKYRTLFNKLVCEKIDSALAYPVCIRELSNIQTIGRTESIKYDQILEMFKKGVSEWIAEKKELCLQGTLDDIINQKIIEMENAHRLLEALYKNEKKLVIIGAKDGFGRAMRMFEVMNVPVEGIVDSELELHSEYNGVPIISLDEIDLEHSFVFITRLNYKKIMKNLQMKGDVQDVYFDYVIRRTLICVWCSDYAPEDLAVTKLNEFL